jgi:pimeloyl-ACP methyl ester carboxylesterase
MSVPISVFTSPEGEAEIMQAYQAIMDHLHTPYQEIKVATSFGETHVIANGPENAQPVVLLHVLSATATLWYRNVEALSQTYRVYTVDVIGEGNKSRPIKPITSMDDFLQWFTQVIDGLGIKTLYLAGNSYGGFTGAYYAMKLPERILKLAMIGPAATIYPMRPFYIHMFIPKAMYGFFPKLPGIKNSMCRSVDWMYAGLPIDPLWDSMFYKSMVYGGLINQVFPRVYSKDEFAQIKAQILLIVGEQEKIYNNLQSAIQSARELVPNLKVEMIPNAHHIAAVANPERVNQALLRFLLNNQGNHHGTKQT